MHNIYLVFSNEKNRQKVYSILEQEWFCWEWYFWNYRCDYFSIWGRFSWRLQQLDDKPLNNNPNDYLMLWKMKDHIPLTKELFLALQKYDKTIYKRDFYSNMLWFIYNDENTGEIEIKNLDFEDINCKYVTLIDYHN
jgi:hypothetical protein